ncbi:DNA-binding response regulator [Cohnella sp.]|uniref:DNA-binding response regulator n=1 Tax=Cohnella sp. TaxID=1883426 RepID=UPI003569D88A
MVNAVKDVQMDEEVSHAYEAWMGKQRKDSKGERRRRLLSHSYYAEKMFIKNVWWPAFGQFIGLQAEYEVRDFKDGWRYLDFAITAAGFKLCIEIDGFGTHWRDLNRTQFSDHLMRQNHLVIDGWLILRFSYDDIVEKPRICQQILQQIMGRLGVVKTTSFENLTPSEQVIMRLAVSHPNPITPQYATAQLGLHRTTVTKHLQSLVSKGLLIPSRADVKRICSYRINRALLPNLLD